MADPLKILIADDDEGDRAQIRRALKHPGLACECVETVSVEEALEACEKFAFDCAVVDYRLPGQNGLWGVSALNARLPHMAIIMATGQGDEMVAAEAMKRGASDYIPKSLITSQSICRSVNNAIEKTSLRRKVARQREELECFASVLVHDLKSPIHSVRGFANAIEQNIEEGNLAELAGYCRVVSSGVERMSALIDALHRYAIAEKAVVLERLEMAEILRHTLNDIEHLIRTRGASITHSELPAVVGHGPLLTQLLQNLVGNGIKYSKAATPSVHVAAVQREDQGWLFSVQDNGIGIPGDRLLEIFEPFKRLHGSGEYEGTGLGLATCRKIVERHDGEIWCESMIGQGTTFFFTLP